MLGDCQRFIHSARFRDLIHPEHRAEAEHLLAELFARQRDSFQIDSQTPTASSRPVRWTVWRVAERLAASIWPSSWLQTLA
jgi:hypothetical protein